MGRLGSRTVGGAGISGALLLNSLQERALWEKIFRNSRNFRDVLHPDRLAAAAQQAYRLPL